MSGSGCLVRAVALALAAMTGAGAPARAGAVADEVVALVNAAREGAGCAPLRIDPRLMAAAEAHADDMARKDFFSHTGSDGSRIAGRINRQGYAFTRAAENIAAGQATAGEAVASWLQSPGHRRNILDCRLRETGVAVVHQADDRPIQGNRVPLHFYWVQVFATP